MKIVISLVTCYDEKKKKECIWIYETCRESGFWKGIK